MYVKLLNGEEVHGTQEEILDLLQGQTVRKEVVKKKKKKESGMGAGPDMGAFGDIPKIDLRSKKEKEAEDDDDDDDDDEDEE